MNCQQKSGVFLNISCRQKAENECSRCQKQVCNSHYRILEKKGYCEDCFWEVYLFSNPKSSDNDLHDDDVIITTSTPINSESNDDGFEGGFGGGGFGGAGAGGEWSSSDMDSFARPDSNQDDYLGNDETFFYS
ncbi:hypothetical protein [Aquimarina spongiae]|uniref:Uncharacterized protein n=1 Tax=Aquimarina spongiae TaxID=570521 RepID=A0A1M6GH67_9FLAO|nr:hypothetical protein [Aquimarina spongiae]SHJ09297.1 hypothetical protein SAMN04488508_105278 [Aquimarina spongiae]